MNLKKLFYPIGFLMIGFFVHAQNSVLVKVSNQYELNVKEFSVKANGQIENYKTDDSGYVNINVPAVESIEIIAPIHDTLKIDVASLKTNSNITLHKIFTWKDLLQPMFYIVSGGLWLLLFIVFAETGLFVGFFLPGDSLLFVAGIYSSNLAMEFLKLVQLQSLSNEWLNLLLLIGLISVAGIIGNTVGYWFGWKSGPYLFHRKDTWLFKKKYLYQAKDFYEKHGGGAIVFARFVPIIRTFAPIIAGVVGMNKHTFSFYNIIGCLAWVFSMILGGHFLQKWILSSFGFNLKQHLEVIVIGIVLITTAPVIYQLFFKRKKS